MPIGKKYSRIKGLFLAAVLDDFSILFASVFEMFTAFNFRFNYLTRNLGNTGHTW